MGLFKGMKDMKGAMDQAQQFQQSAAAQQAAAGAMAGGMPTQQDLTDRDAMQQQGLEYRRLAAEGLSGNAVITSATDTGERLHGNAVLDLALVVTIDGGEPYDATLRYIIAGEDTAPYGAGSSYPVKVDPADRTKLTFG